MPEHRANGHEGEPLVDMISAGLGARFVRASFFAGFLANLVICFSILGYLHARWTLCKRCDRPLRLWLGAEAILQLCQLIVRTAFLSKLEWDFDRDVLAPRIAGIAKTAAFKASKLTSLCNYCWLILGVVWVLEVEECDGCPWLLPVSGSVILQSFVRLGGTVLYFRMVLPEAPPELPEVMPASRAQISALPVITFTQTSPNASGNPSCAVCLQEFCEGHQLRRLPCGHEFHQGCCDLWLARSQRCPLCLQEIDKVRSFGTCLQRFKAKKTA